MHRPQIVIDTNVIVAGLRSQRGYAYKLLQLVGTEHFVINLSVALILEYEDVLSRNLPNFNISQQVIDAILDYHASVARKSRLFFLWRPVLSDPGDDMILELAVNAGCEYIVTFNKRHFRGSERFGVKVIEPREFLALIEVEI